MGARTASFVRSVIVVDANVWIDLLRGQENPLLDELLLTRQAVMHPHVLGEIALGGLKDRDRVIMRLERLPVPNVAREGYVCFMIDEHRLWGTGIGYSDAHLLASARISPDGLLWTQDKRLREQAERLGVAYAA